MGEFKAVRAAEPLDPLPSPSEADVRVQVGRILSGPDFDVPDRGRRFLAYVIEEAMAGRADRLKAYSIAIEVFGRDASFDAQTDPVVRIMASKVRRALERYYLTAGADDPIMITMPKGGYVPLFVGRDLGTKSEPDISAPAPPPVPTTRPTSVRWAWPLTAVFIALALIVGERLLPRSEEQEGSIASMAGGPLAKPDVPRLLVMPFEDLSGTPDSAIIARGLTGEVIGQIAKFKEIVVVAGPHSGDSAGTTSGTNGRARYALEGSVQLQGEKLRLSTRLVNGSDRSVLWTASYDKDLKVRDLLALQDEVARSVATALAQPYGIIFRADAAKASDVRPDDWEAYSCTLAYYAYRAHLKPATHGSVRTCLERAVDRFPDYATAWALLSLTYLDELRFRYTANADTAPPLDRALVAANRALDLDPDSARGIQARMTALFFSGDGEEALKIGAKAVALNPNDTELVGQYGINLALAGDWKRGGELIQTVLDRNPGPLGYYETALALCFYMQRDYPNAAAWIRKANVSANPIYHLVAAAIYGQRGETAAAAAEVQWLLKNAPELLSEVDRELAMRNIPPADQLHFVEGLRKAGLTITF